MSALWVSYDSLHTRLWLESFLHYHVHSLFFFPLTPLLNLTLMNSFVQTGTADSATGYYCHYDDGRLRVGEETSYDINAQMKPKK